MKFPIPNNLEKLYPTQEQFIKDCVSLIKKGGVGVFSSPTGTGKTISLLSSILMFSNKVYYTSRTYSQLNQSINELKKFKNTVHSNEGILLGSRGIYCCNKSINKNELEKINDLCRNLLKNNACSFYNITEFRDLVGIYSIEDILKEKGCPYFLAKSQNKRITFLPYQLVLSKQSRLSYNIDLKDSIIIIDEAHNLLETVVNINTVVIHEFMVKKLINLLFKKKESSFRNLIISVLRRFVSFFNEKSNRESEFNKREKSENKGNIISQFKKASMVTTKDTLGVKETCLQVNEFSLLLGLENYNFFTLEDEAKEFATELEERTDFYKAIAFLILLTYSDEGGRVFISEKNVRFVPLDPKIYFEEVKDAKALILAGGTMESKDVYTRIFGEVSYFSYDSVCKNLKMFLVSKTMNNSEIVLNLDNRNIFVKDICLMITELIKECQRGNVVIFVPSYSFLTLIKSIGLNTTRDIFWDDKLFFTSRNSILVSVMGGKLSEGINFSDDLCRLLIIIGVPYPTLSIELREKEKYFSNEYSTMQAMRNVNQTIGRAIRHKDDYAAVVLIDARYKFLKKHFSDWLKEFVNECEFYDLKKYLNGFYSKLLNTA